MYVASLSAYGYDASDNEHDRRVAIDMATAVFGSTIIMKRLVNISDAIGPCAQKRNMTEDIAWYDGMKNIYGKLPDERRVQYRMYECIWFGFCSFTLYLD